MYHFFEKNQFDENERKSLCHLESEFNDDEAPIMSDKETKLIEVYF